MKTTVDLPDALVNEIQRRAVHEGREVKDVIAELLAMSVFPAATPTENGQTAAKTLPLIPARPVQPAREGKLGTQEWCDWISGVGLDLDVEQYEKASGHQHVDRPDS